MDEPLSNLDAKLRVSARAEIIKLHKRLGTTFIYVTHDQVEAMTMGDRIAVMNDGILMQADTPRALYSEPANAFVAGFIGSPSMNFFDATLVGEEGKLYVDTGDFRVEVPVNGSRAAYEEYVGKEVTFGVRPEHVHAPEYAPPNIIPAPVQANTEVVELLGHEIHLFLNSGRHSFVATVDPRMAVATGNTVDLVFDMSSMHLFDKKTNLAIR
jgi:multiple sugar transport system ATP-binding protein